MEGKKIVRTINEFKAKFLYQAVLVFLVVVVVIPALVYFLASDLRDTVLPETSTCVIEYDYRVPCGFKSGQEMGNVTIYHCKNINCCFDKFTNSCYHYFTAKYGFNIYPDKTYKAKTKYTPMDLPIYQTMAIEVQTTDDYMDVNLVTTDGITVREKDQRQPKENNQLGLVYAIPNDDLTITVNRTNEKNTAILTTLRGPLIASNGYWEWTIQLTNTNDTLYGLGGLQLVGNVTKVIHKNEVDHGNIPYFLAQHNNDNENNVEYHGVLIKYTGILEVQVLASNLIILRALNTTLDGLSLRIFPGPKYEDIQRQLVGIDVKPEIIPRWLLGTHICRNTITDIQGMLNEFVNEQQFDYLHADSDCFNEMLMISLIEMYDVKTKILLKDVINKHKKKRFILPFSPHIPIKADATETEAERVYSLYTDACKKEVLLKNATGEPITGWYKNRRVAFFDPTSRNASIYLASLLKIVGEEIMPLNKIDGIYLLDNWPQDETFNFLPKKQNLTYYNEQITQAVNRTPAILLTQQEQFVQAQIQLFQDHQNLFERKIPIFSSAFYHNHGTFSYPQYVNKTWANLKYLTIRTLFTNMLTTSITLNPVCGTDEGLNDTSHDNELCSRWFINQATMPGLRVTTNWYTHPHFSKTSKNIVLKALKMKRMLSYYQYTVLRKTGHTIRPMFSSFPKDNQTWSLDDQYLMGNLVVVPIFLPQTTVRRFYLPINHTWFEFWGGTNVENGWKNMSISKNERMLFLKEGSVIPVLKKNSKNSYFDLIVTRFCRLGRQVINGSIFLENEFLDFEILDKFLHVINISKVQTDISCQATTKRHPHIIKKIQIHDCNNALRNVEMNFDICHAGKNNTYLPFPI